MKKDKNKQGKKWFVFYAYIRPLLVVLFNIQTTVTLLNAFSELPFYGQVYSIGTILLIAFNIIIWFLALWESKKLILLINYLLIYETISSFVVSGLSKRALKSSLSATRKSFKFVILGLSPDSKITSVNLSSINFQHWILQ